MDHPDRSGLTRRRGPWWPWAVAAGALLGAVWINDRTHFWWVAGLIGLSALLMAVGWILDQTQDTDD